jgi:hypothetical protein
MECNDGLCFVTPQYVDAWECDAMGCFRATSHVYYLLLQTRPAPLAARVSASTALDTTSLQRQGGF